MIEIFVLWRLAKYIGAAAARKGLKKGRYQMMAVLLWICGELLGSAVGNAIFGSGASFWLVYGLALIGALTGAGLAFAIMHFLPKSVTEPQSGQEIPPVQKIGRSVWVPLITILLAVSCVCVVFGGSVILQMRGLDRQMAANNPIIGMEIDGDGRITQPVTEIPSKANAIYFGFDYVNPQSRAMPVTIDWYIDGGKAYSFSKTLEQGQVVVALDRKELEMAAFNKGSYDVIAHVGDRFLTSTSFVVK